MIAGEKGVGKSAILRKAISQKQSDNFLFSRTSLSLKETLINIILCSSPGDNTVQRKNIQALKKLFYAIVDKHPGYLVFDHVGWVGPKFYSLLTLLIERQLPLIIVGRGSEKKDIGHLGMSLYYFAKLEVTNLDRQTADELIDHYFQDASFSFGPDNDFKKQIFAVSRGNPGVIEKLCFLARDEKYQAKGYLDVRLLDLDRRIQESVSQQESHFCDVEELDDY